MKPFTHYGDIYQDIRINGQVAHDGWRECEDRWRMIEGYIPQPGVIMDLGSNAGYFSQRMSERDNNSRVIWSMEYVPARAELQRDMLQANGTENVLLTTKKMGVNEFTDLFDSVNRVDTILALSVLEYYPKAELESIFSQFSQNVPNLIIEFPTPEETGAASAKDTVKHWNPIATNLVDFYEHIELIGESRSATDKNLKRPIYHCSNDLIYREGLHGHMFNDKGRDHTLAYAKGRWVLDGREDITDDPAINLFNAAYHHIEYPAPKALGDRIRAQYQELAKKYYYLSDMFLRNVLLTPTGPRPIDYLEGYAGPEIYNMTREEYLAKFELDLNNHCDDIRDALIQDLKPYKKEGGGYR